jgi:hypothetical protein
VSALITQTDAEPPFDPVYFETVFLVPSPPSPWPSRFAIVTAHNPDGRIAPDQANNEYERALAEHLRRERIDSFAVVGASPDLRHHEAGRGFAFADLSVAADVSARFRQQAFYVIDLGVIFLCVDGSGRGWEVGEWRERLRTAARGGM